MAFEQFTPPRATPTRPPRVSVTAHGLICLSGAAHKMLGSPAAIVLDWDRDEYLLRVRAAVPGARGAYKTGGKSATKAIAGKSFLEWAGLHIPEKAVRFDVRRESAASVVADLSGFPAPKAVTR